MLEPEVKRIRFAPFFFTTVATAGVTALVMARLMAPHEVVVIDKQVELHAEDGVWPMGTFRTENLQVSNQTTMGSRTTPFTSTYLSIGDGSASQTTQTFIEENDTNHVGNGLINEAINLVMRQNATFDTTALPGSSEGLDLVVNSTKSAGANALANTGIVVSVSGADTNMDFNGLAGTFRQVDSALFASDTEIDGALTAKGTCTLGDLTHDVEVKHLLTVDGAGSLVTAATVLGDMIVGSSSPASTLGKLRVNTQNGQDAIEMNYMSGPKCWSFYPSSGAIKAFEYDSTCGGSGKDRFFFDTGGGFESRDAAGTSTVFSVSATGATSMQGALNMNSHLINNVTVPSLSTDAATKGYVDTAIPAFAGTSISSFVYDGGFDSTCTFDGVATPVCGATLSGSVYTMARSLWATNMNVSSGVEVKMAGFEVFVNGTLTLSGTGKLTINGGKGGNAAGGTCTAGAAPMSTSYFYNTTYLAGAGAGGTSVATTNTLPAPVGTAAATNTGGAIGANGNTGTQRFQGGSGGGAGNDVGGGAGAIALTAQALGGYSFIVAQWVSYPNGTQIQGATGGGGGGNNGAGAAGGCGGGPGGRGAVFARIITGAGTIEAKGGDGGTGQAVAGATAGTGGGGGGGGGILALVYQTQSGTVTASVAGGAGGAKGTVVSGAAGGNGGQGASGILIQYNLSGDGTHL